MNVVNNINETNIKIIKPGEKIIDDQCDGGLTYM